jgi:endo-1,4-beta-xylanase
VNGLKDLEHVELKPSNSKEAALEQGGSEKMAKPSKSKGNLESQNPKSETEALFSADRWSTLAKAYEKHFAIGTAVSMGGKGMRPEEWKLAQLEFSSLTPENCGKFSVMQRKQGTFDFSKMDDLVSIAKTHGQEVIGHTLIWGSQVPKWLFKMEGGKTVTRSILIERMRSHITKVLQHYRGKVKTWDTVNEAILGDGSYRENEWYKIIGPEYIEMAFQMAHEVDPSLHLIYNDFGMFNPRKVEGVIKMVKNLKAKGVPIHGIGLQGHWGLSYPSIGALEKALSAYDDLGLKIHISELDITVLPSAYKGAHISNKNAYDKKFDPYLDGIPEEVLQEQAHRYRELFSLFLKFPSITRVTFWGCNDRLSWKNNFPMVGRTDYALLFDRNSKPKPAYDALMELAMEHK